MLGLPRTRFAGGALSNKDSRKESSLKRKYSLKLGERADSSEWKLALGCFRIGYLLHLSGLGGPATYNLGSGDL